MFFATAIIGLIDVHTASGMYAVSSAIIISNVKPLMKSPVLPAGRLIIRLPFVSFISVTVGFFLRIPLSLSIFLYALVISVSVVFSVISSLYLCFSFSVSSLCRFFNLSNILLYNREDCL